jgi:hypothetical protein
VCAYFIVIVIAVELCVLMLCGGGVAVAAHNLYIFEVCCSALYTIYL